MDGDLSSPENSLETISTDSEAELVKCPHCGARLAADAALCPDCGWPMTPLSIAERAVAAAAYLPPLLPAAVILFLPEFRNNRFVRFHAWQSISLWGVFFVLSWDCPLPLERCCRRGFSFLRNSGVAGYVVLVDRADA